MGEENSKPQKQKKEEIEILYKKWKIFKDRKIGGGSFAKVYEGENIKTGEKVAIKLIPREKIETRGKKIKEAIIREIYVLYSISKDKNHNPTLLKFLDHMEGEEGIYIVLEYCDSGTLKGVLKKTKNRKIHESEVIKIAFQIVIGLLELSEKKIIHRDLKPDNIFKHEGLYKIGDFGFANKASKFGTRLGTKNYMAPEFYVLEEDDDLNKAVDIWAFGCLVHEMIFGNGPFIGNNPAERTKRVIFDPYEIPNSPKISKGTKNMLRRCMEKNPSKRITISQLIRHKCFDKCREIIQEKLNFKVKLPPIIIPEPKELEIYQFVRDVTRELEAYRLVYKFFFRTSERLLKVGKEDYCSFIVLKNSLDRATILKKIMGNDYEAVVKNQEIPIKIKKKSFWDYFKLHKNHEKLKKKIKSDIETYREKFEEGMKNVKITKNLEKNSKFFYDEKLTFETIEKLKSDFEIDPKSKRKNLELASNLILISTIEKYKYLVPDYYKIDSFMPRFKKKSDEQILNFLEKFTRID